MSAEKTRSSKRGRPCAVCRLSVGDRVRMKSSFVRVSDGTPLGWVHGVVEPWTYGCGHIVVWRETGAVTPAHVQGVEKDVPEERPS